MLGSRYVAGGRVDDWGAGRRAISRWRQRLRARACSGVDVHDLTGGFKCLRREVLEAIDLELVRSLGYAFQVEMTYRAIAGRLPGRRGADHLPRPPGRRVEDDRLDRRSRPPGGCPRCGSGGDRRVAPSAAWYYIFYSIETANRATIRRRGRRTTVTGNLPDVTDANFQAEVLDSETPVLVDFWAPWCGPCRVVHPILEEIDDERDDVRIVSLNVDENQQTAATYEVLSIPTMILFKDGEIAKRVVGAMPKKRLEAELEPALA